MSDALIVCPESPYPVAGGGPLRTACMVEYLSSRYALDVIAFREPGAPDPRQAFPLASFRNLAVIDLPYHSKRAAARVLRNIERIVRNVPPLIDRFSGFDLPIRRKYDLAVIEHFWCAPYVAELRRHCRRIVLNLHNVESVLLRRCADTESAIGAFALNRFARVCSKLERDLLSQFDEVLVTSEVDRSLVGRGIVWPNTIGFVSQPEARPRNAIVFSGNMGYHPNTAAARYFAREVWPGIAAAEPDLTWELIGKNPDALAFPPNPRIRVVGPVDDAIGSLAGAKVAVVPILSGSGTRFKILEAWAAGVPVVSTSMGAEGLGAVDGQHLMLADTPSSFSAAVRELLHNKSVANQIRQAGRQLYEGKFTWPVAWKILQAVGM